MEANEVANPDLFISVGINETDKIYEMVKLLYPKLSQEEIEEKIDEIQLMITLNHFLGLSCDKEKIRGVVIRLRERNREISRIINLYNNGQISFYVPAGTSVAAFLEKAINSVSEKYFADIKKDIGKRNFKKIFGEAEKVKVRFYESN